MLHSGIDLHKRDLVIATADPAGVIVHRGKVPATRPAVLAYFRALGLDQRAVVESTATWYWLADLLRAEGVALTLGHSKYIKAIRYAKVKTDAVDAVTLAQLLRSDLVPKAHMISPELREPRDLLRQRLVLVAKRTRCKNAVNGLVAQLECAWRRRVATPRAVPSGAADRAARAPHLQIKRVEHELHPTLVPNADVQRLLWIPGIGKIGAFTLYLADRRHRALRLSAVLLLLLSPCAGREELRRQESPQALEGWQPVLEARVQPRVRARDPKLSRDQALVRAQATREGPDDRPGARRQGSRGLSTMC